MFWAWSFCPRNPPKKVGTYGIYMYVATTLSLKKVCFVSLCFNRSIGNVTNLDLLHAQLHELQKKILKLCVVHVVA